MSKALEQKVADFLMERGCLKMAWARRDARLLVKMIRGHKRQPLAKTLGRWIASRTGRELVSPIIFHYGDGRELFLQLRIKRAFCAGYRKGTK